MNTRRPAALLSIAATPGLAAQLPSAPPRPLRGLYASLERLINTASFVSVDLTDTVLASLQEQRAHEARRRLNCSE